LTSLICSFSPAILVQRVAQKSLAFQKISTVGKIFFSKSKKKKIPRERGEKKSTKKAITMAKNVYVDVSVSLRDMIDEDPTSCPVVFAVAANDSALLQKLLKEDGEDVNQINAYV
jgi:hypothetical protein